MRRHKQANIDFKASQWWFIFADACECESNVTTYFSGKVKCEKFEAGSSAPALCLPTADNPVNCPSLSRILTQFFIFYPGSTLKEVQQLPLNHPYLGHKAQSENIGNVGNLRGILLKTFKYSILEGRIESVLQKVSSWWGHYIKSLVLILSLGDTGIVLSSALHSPLLTHSRVPRLVPSGAEDRDRPLRAIFRHSSAPTQMSILTIVSQQGEISLQM